MQIAMFFSVSYAIGTLEILFDSQVTLKPRQLQIGW
jgi:hypothetical protein